jgi:hypothetical protein
MFLKGRTLPIALGLVCLGAASSHAASAKILCYLWADQPSPTINTPYTPDPTYSFSSRRQPISVSKLSTGVYLVTCSGEGGRTPGGHVQVSSYGDGLNTFCHVGSWSTGAPDFVATVNCFGKGGGNGGGPGPADSSFDLLFVR